MKGTAFWVVSLGLLLHEAVGLAPAFGAEPLPIPDETSGLALTCRAVKTNFVVGEVVTIACQLTNTTEKIKPVVWHPSAGSHFCLVQGETNWMGGVLPLVSPQLAEGIQMKSTGWSPENILFLGPHTSLSLVLTYPSEKPEKFNGRLVYDPMTHGGGFLGDDALEKAKKACLFSRPFEYNVQPRRKEGSSRE